MTDQRGRVPDHTGPSPLSGYTRAHWEVLADDLLLATRPHFSPDHAGLYLAGRHSRYGVHSDALEGYARTFLLAAARVAGEQGGDPHGLMAWYAEGLRAGVTPGHPHAWPRADENPQSKVEAAILCYALHLSRPWLWDHLDEGTRARVVDWLSPTGTEDYPPINWVWFQLMAQGFLHSVGADARQDRIDGGLDVHEACYRGDGWYADGTERAFDHYNGWAFHTYPLLWAQMVGPELCPPHLNAASRDRLRLFLDDFVHMIGGNGAPMIQGRSLLYRFSAAVPLWVGAMTGATDLAPGLLRRAASGMVRYFVDAGAVDHRGIVPLGFHGEYLPMLQSYSGPGSPYWVSHGMLGLALPADHPVWTAPEEPLPVERHDFVRPVRSPGWLLSGTRGDGIVRLVNHGTDHAHAGDVVTDAPMYTHVGYSTHTFPSLSTDPGDNAVLLLDAAGRPSHRAGFERLRCEVRTGEHGDGDATVGVGVGVSRGRVHWIDWASDTSFDHGSGRGGPTVTGPVMTLVSLVRGPDEVRVAIIGPQGAAEVQRVEFRGWPVTQGVHACLSPIRALGEPIREAAPEPGPMGPFAVDVCSAPLASDGVHAALIRLGSHGDGTPRLDGITATSVSVSWADGQTSSVSW